MERLEADLGSRATVLRVSINSELGRKLGNQYVVPGVPYFIIFDAQGQETSRSTAVPVLESILAIKQ